MLKETPRRPSKQSVRYTPDDAPGRRHNLPPSIADHLFSCPPNQAASDAYYVMSMLRPLSELAPKESRALKAKISALVYAAVCPSERVNVKSDTETALWQIARPSDEAVQDETVQSDAETEILDVERD